MSVGVVNKQTGDRIPTAGMPAIDSVLSGSSTNPVQNAVITAALAGKADTGIVADDFDSTASYVIGNYCIKDGKLYRFKANHSGAWAAADVDEIKIAGELSSIKSGLIKIYHGTVTSDAVYGAIAVPNATNSLIVLIGNASTVYHLDYNNPNVFILRDENNNAVTNTSVEIMAMYI